MSIFIFILWTIFILWLGFLAGQWYFGDRQFPYRHVCDGTCYEYEPFRIATNEKSYARQAMLNHLELQHE